MFMASQGPEVSFYQRVHFGVVLKTLQEVGSFWHHGQK